MTLQLEQHIPWDEVVAVGVRTTGDGPFGEDLYWQFWLGDQMIEVAGAAVAGQNFDVLGERLPGIDWRKVIQATGSTEDRMFGVWQRGAEDRPTEQAQRGRFMALVGRLGGNPASADPVWARLVSAWTAGTRSYHSVDHLAACLRELDGAGIEPAVAGLVELALCYHDAIYEPGARDNEARSARLLEADAVDLALPAGVAEAAAALVLATAHGQGGTPSGDRATDLIIDIDLAILGRDVVHFLDYEHSIEDEFAARSPLWFRIARGRFLAALLATRSIYRTEQFRAKFERRARAQISALLASPRYRAYRWLRWLPIGR